MKDLKILDLYTNSSTKKLESFSDSLSSSLEVAHNYNEYVYDDEWIEKIEEALKYIDNILRNPNRFIVNEEEVVKIELARRITVESIKHLSKNTNFIQDMDMKTGDVKPAKILNINKEESYNTYENRFIYSLIKNLNMYINLKKQYLNTEYSGKNEKRMQYTGATQLGSEDVSININLTANSKGSKSANQNLAGIVERIKKVENQILELMHSELYLTLVKANVGMVTSPIKKTNMILKNNNFQYAVNLWNYIQTHIEDESKLRKGNDVLKDDPALKEFIDETFMINYLVADSIDSREVSAEKKKEASEYLVTNLVQKIITTNSDLTKKELSKLIEDKFVYIKNQDLAKTDEIKKIFKTAIHDYEEIIKNAKLRSKHEKKSTK